MADISATFEFSPCFFFAQKTEGVCLPLSNVFNCEPLYSLPSHCRFAPLLAVCSQLLALFFSYQPSAVSCLPIFPHSRIALFLAFMLTTNDQRPTTHIPPYPILPSFILPCPIPPCPIYTLRLHRQNSAGNVN